MFYSTFKNLFATENTEVYRGNYRLKPVHELAKPHTTSRNST